MQRIIESIRGLLEGEVGEISKNAVPCRTIRHIEGRLEAVCPHCNKEIGEKEMYCEQDPNGTWVEFHRPCIDKGPIVFPDMSGNKASVDVIGELDDIIKIQCANGNWNYDAYMHGLANGLIVARQVLTASEEPELLDAPEQWLCNESMVNLTHRLLEKAFKCKK